MGLAVLQEQCYFLNLSSYFVACAAFFFPDFSFSLRVSVEDLPFHPTVTVPMTGRHQALVDTMAGSCTALVTCILSVRLKNRH